MTATGPSSPPVDAPGLDAPAADDPAAQALVEPSVVSRRGGGAMLRSSAIYSALTLVSRFLGFGRDLVVTAVMGAGMAADAWNTALAFPNLFRRFFAEGAFAAAFVPAYAKALARDGEERADVLAADAMATLAAATIVLTLVAELTMPWLMFLISPGFAHDPAKFKLAVLLTQITMPYLPCMAIYAHLSGVLNARGRFIVSALAPSLLNIGTLVAVLPQHTPVDAAKAAAVGAVGSGIAQAALLWWGVRRSGARVDVRMPRLTPEIRGLIGLALPGAVAASATQLNVFVSSLLASWVPGARSWLAVADRLYQLPLGLVGVAIGVALLPRLSTAVQSGDSKGAAEAMDEAVTIALALTLPAAAALTAMPVFLIDALFTRAEFLAADADATGQALLFYGLGTPAFVLARILSPAFFARQDTASPMRFALVSMAINIGFGALFFAVLHRIEGGGAKGAEGIAAATALASWVNVIQMMTALHRRGIWTLKGRALARVGRIALAAVILGGFMAAASATRAHWALGLLHRKEAALAVVVLLVLALYAALCLALRVLTPAELRAALRRSPKTGGPPVAGETL